MNIELNEKRINLTGRAGVLAANSVKLPRAYDINMHIVRSSLAFLPDNADIMIILNSNRR